MTEFIPQDIINLHGFAIGLDKDQVSVDILRALLKGWYERDELEIIEKLLKPKDRVLEIGSAIGVTTMKVAKMLGDKNVFPYELNPYLIAWAEDNFKRNGFDVSVTQQALIADESSAPDILDFHIHEAFWASSLIKPSGPHHTIQVPTAPIQAAIEQHRANVLLIDIEGGEQNLLPNMDLAAIDKIIMELHYDVVGKKETNQMIAQLVAQGFFLDLSISSRGVVALYRI